MTRRFAVMAAVCAVLAVLGGTPSVAGVDSERDSSGDVKAKGLTAAERRALDIVSVKTTGAADLGAFVTVTFRGNIEKALGHGHLKRAAVGLLLRAKPGQGATAGLVSQGAGTVGKVLRHTASADVGAYRDGRRLTFFVLGPGFDKLRSIDVKTVRDARLTAARAAQKDDTPYIGQRIWDRFITLHPIDLHVQVGDPSSLSCVELNDLLASIDSDLDDPFFSQNVSFSVVRALHKFRSKVKGLIDKCEPPPPPDLEAAFDWSRFSPQEVAGKGRFTGRQMQLSAVRIVLPEQYTITNHLCPTQLPMATIDKNAITCGGGTLSTGQDFNLNLQTSPAPPNGIGGQLFGQTGGTFAGPFAITGP